MWKQGDYNNTQVRIEYSGGAGAAAFTETFQQRIAQHFRLAAPMHNCSLQWREAQTRQPQTPETDSGDSIDYLTFRLAYIQSYWQHSRPSETKRLQEHTRPSKTAWNFTLPALHVFSLHHRATSRLPCRVLWSSSSQHQQAIQTVQDVLEVAQGSRLVAG